MIINESYFKDDITSDDIVSDVESTSLNRDIDYLQTGNAQYPYTLCISFTSITEDKTTIHKDIKNGHIDNIAKTIKYSLDACPFIYDYFEPISCVITDLLLIYNKEQSKLKQHINKDSSVVLFYDDKEYNFQMYTRTYYVIRFNSRLNSVSKLFNIFKFLRKPFLKAQTLSMSMTVHPNYDKPIDILADYRYISNISFDDSRFGMYEFGQMQFLSQIAEHCNIHGHLYSDSVAQYKVDFKIIQKTVLNNYAKACNSWFLISKEPVGEYNKDYTDWKALLSSQFAKPHISTCPKLDYIKNNSLHNVSYDIDSIINDSDTYTVYTTVTSDEKISSYIIWVDRTTFVNVDNEEKECCLFFEINAPGWLNPTQEEVDNYKMIEDLFNE